MPYNKTNLKVLTLAILSSFLTACGGGADSADSTTSSSEPSAPIQITSSNWQSSATSSTQARTITPNIYTVSSSASPVLQVNARGLNDLSNKYWQVHIDIDNNPETGYQFEHNAWSNLSGVDYIVQNGYVFKSTANDNSWSWERQDELPIFQTDKFPVDGSLGFSLDAYNKGICGTINVGVIVLDQDWNIETFLPVANSLLKQTTTFCETNHPPVITANLSSQVLTVGDEYIETGATAIDVEDGDITSNIIVTHRSAYAPTIYTGESIDTSVPGYYWIYYEVTDSDGKTRSAQKTVIVKVPTTGSILIDGLYDMGHLHSGYTGLFEMPFGTMIVADDEDYLYLLVRSLITPSDIVPELERGVNWQLYIDSDNNIDTGYRLQNGGADYLIENGSFSTFLGNGQYQWSWDYRSAEIEYAEIEGVFEGDRYPSLVKSIEIAIPKENFPEMGDSVSISFSVRDENWKEGISLPLTSGTMINHPLMSP